ncbi:MAG: tetratricopeptide repeat protein, partial [Planctomycetota bacterium]
RGLKSLAIFYKATGRHKDADNLYKRIREIEQGVSANSGFSQSSQLADEHFEKANQLYKQGRILAACGMFEKSVEAEKDSQNPRLSYLSAELSWAGYCYLDLGQYDKAIKYYEEALVISRKLGREDYVSISLSGIGRVYESWGQYDKAIKYYEEALIIDRKLGQKDKIALGLNAIGRVYNSWGQYDKAIKYYEEALII